MEDSSKKLLPHQILSINHKDEVKHQINNITVTTFAWRMFTRTDMTEEDLFQM